MQYDIQSDIQDEPHDAAQDTAQQTEESADPQQEDARASKASDLHNKYVQLINNRTHIKKNGNAAQLGHLVTDIAEDKPGLTYVAKWADIDTTHWHVVLGLPVEEATEVATFLHKATVVKGKKYGVCSPCGYVTTTMSNLTKHKKSSHCRAQHPHAAQAAVPAAGTAARTTTAPQAALPPDGLEQLPETVETAVQTAGTATATRPAAHVPQSRQAGAAAQPTQASRRVLLPQRVQMQQRQPVLGATAAASAGRRTVTNRGGRSSRAAASGTRQVAALQQLAAGTHGSYSGEAVAGAVGAAATVAAGPGQPGNSTGGVFLGVSTGQGNQATTDASSLQQQLMLILQQSTASGVVDISTLQQLLQQPAPIPGVASAAHTYPAEAPATMLAASMPAEVISEAAIAAAAAAGTPTAAGAATTTTTASAGQRAPVHTTLDCSTSVARPSGMLPNQGLALDACPISDVEEQHQTASCACCARLFASPPRPYIIKVADADPKCYWGTIFMLMVLLILVVPLLSISPVRVGSFSDACKKDHRAQIIKSMSDELRVLTNLTGALDLVNVSEADWNELNQTITKSTYQLQCDNRPGNDKCQYVPLSDSQYMSYPNWPNGCSDETAKKIMNEAMQKKCSENVCAKPLGWDWFGATCKVFEYPCPAPAAFQGAAFNEHARQQALRNSTPTADVQVYVPADLQDNALLKGMLEKLQGQIDMATLVYSIYLAIGIFYGPVFRYYRRSFRGQVCEMLLGVREVVFVILFLLLWTFWGYMRVKYSIDNFPEFWKVVLTAPCLMSSTLAGDTRTAIVSVCNTLGSARTNFSRNVNELQGISLSAQAYAVCQADCWRCQADWEARYPPDRVHDTTYATKEVEKLIADTMMMPQYQEGFQFPAMCNLTEIREYVGNNMVNWSQKTGANTLAALFQGGLISAALFKLVLCRFMISFATLIVPFVTHNQGVEAYPSDRAARTAVTDDKVIQISKMYLREMHGVYFIITGVLLGLMIWNIIGAKKTFWTG